MQSSNQHSFAHIEGPTTERSTFNRSCAHKTVFDGGHLCPIFIDEVLPGDTMSLKMSTFARLATPLVPILDNMMLDSFFFFVPNRLIWENWNRFCGEQDDPGDDTDFLIPQMTTEGTTGMLSDFMGIPTEARNLTHSAMWHRAYNLIWNEWFRDENLQDRAVEHKDDGPDPAGSYPVRRRGKRRDYFSSCLPWPQKGDAVTIPMSGNAVVTMDAQQLGIDPDGTDVSPTFFSQAEALTAGSGSPKSIHATTGNPTGNAFWADPHLEVELSGATGIADMSQVNAQTINQLRQAFQIQRLLERDARGGTRYTEIVRSHFGVTSPDARLQRPEFLGGGSQNISVTPVPQTSSSDVTTPQGNLAAYGVSSGSNHGFNKTFTEHGVIVGLISVRADLNYQRGLPRMFSRRTRLDFFWPALAHIGEQAVLNKEIYAVGDTDYAQDDAVFGYQERWAEYRYKPSHVSRAMRSSHPQSLDIWHLAQDFDATLPVLGDAFIQETPPIDRIIAVVDEPHFLLDAYFDFKCARKMPTYSTPGMIDHF